MFYQDGKNDKTEPYTHCLMTILILELFTILVGMDVLNLFIDVRISTALVSLCGGIHNSGMILLASTLTPSYYFFIKKKRFDSYYNEFRNANINTLKNRKIGYICLVLYVPVCICLIALLSY